MAINRLNGRLNVLQMVEGYYTVLKDNAYLCEIRFINEMQDYRAVNFSDLVCFGDDSLKQIQETVKEFNINYQQ